MERPIELISTGKECDVHKLTTVMVSSSVLGSRILGFITQSLSTGITNENFMYVR